MSQPHVSLGLIINFMFWQCCDYGLCKLRQKKHLVWFCKRFCFGLKYLLLSSRTWLEMSWGFLKNIELVSHRKLLKHSLGLRPNMYCERDLTCFVNMVAYDTYKCERCESVPQGIWAVPRDQLSVWQGGLDCDVFFLQNYVNVVSVICTNWQLVHHYFGAEDFSQKPANGDTYFTWFLHVWHTWHFGWKWLLYVDIKWKQFFVPEWSKPIQSCWSKTLIYFRTNTMKVRLIWQDILFE